MKQKLLFSLLASMFILQSCEKNIDIDFPIAPSPYVIEGYIENGQGPFVTVSRGISFINEISNDDFLNLFVDNAKISLTVNNDTTAIELKMVKIGNASFYIDTTNLIGVIGNTYHIKVAVDGQVFTSSTQILAPAPLDSIIVEPAPISRADTDSLVQLTAYFSEPNPIGNYYRLLSKKNNDPLFDVAFNSIYDDAIVNGKAIQFTIAGGKSQFQNNDTANFRQYGYFKKGDKVLEIGTGSMYQTSVLAEMGAQVFTIERQKQLFDKTAKYVFKDLYLNVQFFFGDGFEGLPHLAPFDKILITAAAPHLPEKLWAQLKTSGKMIIPLDESETAQRMMRLTKKRDGSVKKEAFDQFSFVPMLQGKTQK